MTRLFAFAFWCAAAFAFVMAVLPHPPQVPLNPTDKIQHIAAFSCLAVLGSLGYPRLPMLRLAAGLCAFGALIEIVQLIPVLQRDSDVADWAADTAAIAVTLLVVRVWLALRARRAEGS